MARKTTALPQVITNKTSSASEQYRTLATNLSFLARDQQLKSILFTSPEGGAGKSTTVANVASVLALQGLQVLCIDMDLRKPTIHKHFQLPNRFGVTNHIVSEVPFEDCIQNVADIDNLSVMTSGAIPPNPSEIINSKGMFAFIESLTTGDLSNNFDIILVDAPPILVVGDAKSLATQIQAVVLVTRLNQTRKAEILMSHQELTKVKANVLGVVLNCTHKSQHNYYYGL